MIEDLLLVFFSSFAFIVIVFTRLELNSAESWLLMSFVVWWAGCCESASCFAVTPFGLAELSRLLLCVEVFLEVGLLSLDLTLLMLIDG